MLKSLLITRPAKGAQEFWRQIAAAVPGKFEPVFAPLSEIVPLEAAIDLAAVSGLIFTSANAVAQFAARWHERKITAWCVGDATRDAAEASGFDAVSAQGNGDDLARLIRRKTSANDSRLLHVRGVHSTGFGSGLLHDGWTVQAAIIYEQRAKMIDGAAAEKLQQGIDVATFFSPRAAGLFVQSAQNAHWKMDDSLAVCLSSTIAAAARETAFRDVVACKHPDMAHMIAELTKLS